MTNIGSRPYSSTRRGRNARHQSDTPSSIVVSLWRRNHDLLHNASTLIATTGVTAGLGFVYWAIGARLFSERSVGYGSASVSAMTLLGAIGMFGLGTVLIGELPRRKRAGGLISAALIVSSVGSLVLGVGSALIAPHVSSNLIGIGGSLGRVTLFAVGVLLTSFTLVVDQATIGILRGGIQLERNIAFALAKLLILPVASFTLHGVLGMGITFSWVGGMAVSLIPIGIRLKLSGTPVLPKPDWRLLRGLGKTAMAHNWLNLAISIPVLIMPVIVTATVSASANAAYYIAWMLAYFLYLIPTNLSTVLFAIAAAEPKIIAEKLRLSLRISFAIGILGIVILGLGSHLVLTIFGSSYAHTATLPLILLVLGYIPMVPRTHYVAVCRARGRIPQAAVILSIGAVLEITGAVVGAKLDGLTGLSAALLVARIIEGIITTPSVVRASIGYSRRKVTQGTESSAATYEEQQGTGIAALISLAASTMASQVQVAMVEEKVPLEVVPREIRGMVSRRRSVLSH